MSSKINEKSFVISGIAGRYPNCRNVNELKANLYNQIDMISDREARWSNTIWSELPKRKGILCDVTRFDASFFGIHSKLVHETDPQVRILLELAHEAIFDAGVHPESIRGSRTNVYIAQGLPETLAYNLCSDRIGTATTTNGSISAMLAGRVAYHLHLNGAAFVVDTACSGSMAALHLAYNDLRLGNCDAALVGACNLLLNPVSSECYVANNMLSMDGYCRSLDEKASGFVRSEAVVMIFLQRELHAKRIYAHIVHVDMSNDGFKQEGISYPSIEKQTELLTRFYKDIDIHPHYVGFFEGHFTGTVAGDLVECCAVDNVFCTDRETPLLLGAIKSNMGHAESASGLCGLTKALLTFETGLIPPNLHYEEARKDIPGLVAKRLKVCTEKTPLSGPFIALNSIGFIGSNVHCLLRQWHKMKVNGGTPDDSLPRLINWAGRTEESISSIFDQITAMPMDAEFIGLLHEMQETAATGYFSRGFGIFESRGITQNAICLAKEQNYSNEEKRPVVWLLSGMGSQWCQMGESLQKIPIARDTIDQCHRVLQPYGIDLWSIITSNVPATFENIINAFVGIGAIQIALINILRAVNMPYDFLIGHSSGETMAAYADGSMNLDEALMTMYWRGKVSLDESFIDGRMAAVGLSSENIKDQLPAGVYVACENSSTSCTLSGPKDKIEQFVAELKSKGIFAKSVNSGGIAYHSKYIHGAKERFLEKFRQTIAVPKMRSEKWLSTSVPMEDWNLPAAKFSSAEYFLNNLLNPVLFQQALRLLPTNSIIIEIAPCALMQAIMKRELPDAIHIPMMQKFSENNSINILKALGRVFNHGIPLRIKELYPPIQFPVSRGTPMIAPLIKWDHSDEWNVYEHSKKEMSRERKLVVNIGDKDSEYMSGHIIDDRCLLPAMSYLHFVRESLVYMTPGATFDTMNVHFKDVKWLRATSLQANCSVHLTINIQRDSGRFEVTEDGMALVQGTVNRVHFPEPITQLDDFHFTSEPILKENDFYKELRIRGYMYESDFKGVHSARADGRRGLIEWKNDNWATFMDAMLQVAVLSQDSRSLKVPTGIREIKINAADHLNYLKSLRNGVAEAILCEVRMSPELNTIVCGGIEITGLTTDEISRRHQNGVKVLDRYEFVPLNGDDEVHTIDDAVRICTQLIHETLQTNQIRLIEVLDRDASFDMQPIAEHLKRALLKIPLINGDVVLETQRSFPHLVDIVVPSNTQLSSNGVSTAIFAAKCMSDVEFAATAAKNLVENGFLISIEPTLVTWTDLTAPIGFQLLSLVRSESISLVLMQRRGSIKAETNAKNVTIRLFSEDSEYKWLKSLQEALESPSSPSITLVVQDDAASGALGFVNCLRREKLGRKIQLVQIENGDHITIDQQLTLGLPINIRRDGRWGTYRHMNIVPKTIQRAHDQSVQLSMQKIGDFTSIVWTQARNPKDRINVHYATLNFRDVIIGSGRLSLDMLKLKRMERNEFLGFEFAGMRASGERIMGMSTTGSIATQIDGNNIILGWKVPDEMSLREAATIPVAYLTVYYAFFVNNEVKAGKSILIHAGTGGVGFAAIHTAFAYGLRVFTTVSSPEKRNFLMREFADLNEKHIGNSRDCSFEKMIMDETNGEGVDYVLNSLSEEKLMASLRCLRTGGQFLEIGKFDIFNNSNMGMRPFENGITFRSIFADHLMKMPDHRRIIQDRVEMDLARGIIRPLPSTVFTADEAEKAFRYLSEAKHIGKVLLQMRESNGSPTLSLNILPKIVCKSELVYVLVGGLGGFGMELADWLVIRGAQNIILNSRCGARNAYQLYRIGVWKSYGCNVCISTDNTTTRFGCENLLKKASTYGQVGGIFNVAVVLSDQTVENQTPESFNQCLAPKALSTQHLDKLSRQMCPKLEHFVVFSSVACGLGSAGQTNYGMANAIMERIIERRVHDKLPGKAIQWGAVGDVGIIAETFARSNNVEVLGTIPQRIDNCLIMMDELMGGDAPIVTSMIVSQTKQQAKKLDLVGTVLSIIGITDIKSVSIHATLTELGVDSLMNSEIKQMLERNHDIQLKNEDIRMLTVAKLTEMTTEMNKRSFSPVTDEPMIPFERTKLSMENEKRSSDNPATSEPFYMFSGTILENMGNESTKNMNIINGNMAAHTADDSAPCVLVISGIDGIAIDALIKFCHQMKMPAFILQLHTTHRLKNIDDVIEHLAADILDLHKSRKRFCVAAYSFGTVLATKVARLLEREPGRKGHIYMIDGNPYALQKYFDLYSGCPKNSSIEQFEMRLLAKVLAKLPKKERTSIEAKMAMIESLDEAVEIMVAEHTRIKYSKGYLKECILGYIHRCVMVREANWKVDDGKIDSDITLIQATKSFIDSDADGVAELTNGKTVTSSFDANHWTILECEAAIQMIV